MSWALSTRVTFNTVNIYCHNWHKEYKYFVFDEIATVSWQQEKSSIFCIVTASIIFVAKMAFVLQRTGCRRGAPAGKAFLRGESHSPPHPAPERSRLQCRRKRRHTTQQLPPLASSDANFTVKRSRLTLYSSDRISSWQDKTKAQNEVGKKKRERNLTICDHFLQHQVVLCCLNSCCVFFL